MNRLEEDIKKGTFARVYLLYGEEEYLKKYYTRKLIRALIPDDNTINLNIWKEAPVDVGELMEQALTLPFFAEHRLIVVSDSTLFKSGGQDLAEWIPNIPPETVLLFSEKDVDERSKLFKAVKNNGAILKLDRIKGKQLENWILAQLSKAGRTKIQSSAMRLLLDRVGDDMLQISSELEKLISYTHGRDTILEEDVKNIITVRLENRIFEMTDSIAYRRRGRVLDLYHELLALKESPLGILTMLFRQFERMLRVKELRDRGLDVQTISEKLSIQAFRARKIIGQSEQFTMTEIEEILRRMGETDSDIKRGKMKDEMAVELLIIWITREG